MKTVRPKWALTEGQASALFGELAPLAGTLVGLALLTGLRRGELFALRWKDVSQEDDALTVREAVYEGRFDTPKTAAGRRSVPLSPLAKGLVTEWRDRVTRKGAEDLLFATWSGKPIMPNNVLRSQIFPACERLGLPRTTWLTFRRTYSSWAHDKGVPGKVVAQMLGHASVDTTLNVYTQVIDGALRIAAQKVGDGSQLFTEALRRRTHTPLPEGRPPSGGWPGTTEPAREHPLPKAAAERSEARETESQSRTK